MDRRQFLRGVGGLTLGLPAMGASAGSTSALATTATGVPLRTVFVYFPNGAQPQHWGGDVRDGELAFGQTLTPLAKHSRSLQLLHGFDHANAEPGKDGAGDHARANATFLTGVRAKKTAGADIHLGRSIDQVIASAVGDQTRFPSLELSCDSVRKSGQCDSGYSCAYQYNLSWRSETQPMAPETNPRALYERLFGVPRNTQSQSPQLLSSRRKNQLLSLVWQDAKATQRTLGSADRRKLDEYLQSVRQIEVQLSRAESFGPLPRPDMAIPEGISESYERQLDVMFDLLAVALQSDATRVATMMMAADGSNRPFPQIGIPEGHHWLTHQSKDEARRKVAMIDRYYATRFAKFLDRLQSMKDPDGQSVLHNSMIVYGSGIGDGNRHNHDNLPVLLAGNGGGGLTPSRVVDGQSKPMSNLFVGLAERVGV
ncbi:MAG: DUF1552 domain-containing protein, partial [Planctomycetota bacterium]